MIPSMKPMIHGLLATLLVAGASRGAITYSGVLDIPIPTSFDGVYLNLIPVENTEPSGPSGAPDPDPDRYTVSFTEPADWDVNFFFGGIGIAHSPSFNPYRADASDKVSPVHNLGLNIEIDGGPATTPGSPPLPPGGSNPLTLATFGGSGDATGNPATNHLGSGAFQFQSGTEGYLAFVLTDSGTDYNGWMRVTLTDNGTPGTIHDWAYDTAPIQVGTIPEPSATILLIAGGMLLWRRRR